MLAPGEDEPEAMVEALMEALDREAEGRGWGRTNN
jgi:hypothetical protein